MEPLLSEIDAILQLRDQCSVGLREALRPNLWTLALTSEDSR